MLELLDWLLRFAWAFLVWPHQLRKSHHPYSPPSVFWFRAILAELINFWHGKKVGLAQRFAQIAGVSRGGASRDIEKHKGQSELYNLHNCN